MILGAVIALAGSILGGLWLARVALVGEKRLHLYETVLPALRPGALPAPGFNRAEEVLIRFDEIRCLGRLLTKRERQLVDELMKEHFKLGDRIRALEAPDRYGQPAIGDRTAYDGAVAEFDAHRAALESEMARRLRRWI